MIHFEKYLQHRKIIFAFFHSFNKYLVNAFYMLDRQ